MALEIETAEDSKSIARCFGVLSQLRQGLSEPEFVARVMRQQATGYRLVMGCEQGEVVVVAGFRIRENLALGRHLYVEDLATGEQARGRGHGAALLEHIATLGRSEDCGLMVLDSGVQRFAAHRFYLRERFEIRAYLFAKSL